MKGGLVKNELLRDADIFVLISQILLGFEVNL